jgi:hypothetical protein
MIQILLFFQVKAINDGHANANNTELKLKRRLLWSAIKSIDKQHQYEIKQSKL